MRIRRFHILIGLILLFAFSACRKDELTLEPVPDPPEQPATPETPQPPETPPVPVYTGTIFPDDL